MLFWHTVRTWCYRARHLTWEKGHLFIIDQSRGQHLSKQWRRAGRRRLNEIFTTGLMDMWLKYTLLWAVGRVGVLLADVPFRFRSCLTRLLWGGEDQRGLGNETVASLMFALTSLHKHKNKKTYLTSYGLLSILMFWTEWTEQSNRLICRNQTMSNKIKFDKTYISWNHYITFHSN